MDRIAKVVTKRRLDEPDTSWIDYWRTRPVADGSRWRPSSVRSAWMEILSKDFVEFIECCAARDVKF